VIRLGLAAVVLVGCKKEEEPPPLLDTAPPQQEENDYPMPDDLDSIDFVTAFQDAMNLLITVSTQRPWEGHAKSLDTRRAGCPDFWTGQFTDAGVLVGQDYGVSWSDDCATESGLYYDGWVWWDFDVQESGDPDSDDGRVAEASRTITGDGTVGNEDGVRFEFDGTGTDTFYQLDAASYERFVYSTSLQATVTGSDVFANDSLTPDGFRTDLYMAISGGDVDVFEARGDVYLFHPQLMDRFDSVGVDMVMQGTLGAAPDDCTLEPLGWIGLRDENAYWYDIVFLPRSRDDIIGEEYPNDPLSICDGCGRLYVQGVEQEGRDVCVDFSSVFGGFPLPDPDDYVLPLHSL
jgi:hypothetical protein